jgi:hypothetical protein
MKTVEFLPIPGTPYNTFIIWAIHFADLVCHVHEDWSKNLYLLYIRELNFVDRILIGCFNLLSLDSFVFIA